MNKTQTIAARSQPDENSNRIEPRPREQENVRNFAVYKIYGFGSKLLDFGLCRILNRTENNLLLESPVAIRPGRQLWLSLVPEKKLLVIKAEATTVKPWAELFHIELKIIYRMASYRTPA